MFLPHMNPGRILPLLLCALFCSALNAQGDAEEVVVTGVTPGSVSGLPATRIPYHIQSAASEDMATAQSLDLTEYLQRNLAGISINEAQSNPLQPDLQYRGFSASPLLGLAQGLAVFQNGIRINEPLGDAVNWDLLPESAIRDIRLIGGSNPLFGLNTLGGALAIRMKDGFGSPGHQLRVQAGSFGRRIVTVESGGNDGRFGYYGNVHYFSEDGWRRLSTSRALNFYGNLGWQGSASELQLDVQHGTSELFGNGPLPVELLAQDRSTVFTAPDITENEMYQLSISGRHAFSPRFSVAADAFLRRNRTDSFNGDASEFTRCSLAAGDFLLAGLEADDLTDLGLDTGAVCDENLLIVADPAGLEDALNMLLEPGAAAFNLEDLTPELSGSGFLADQAINNISSRRQRSYGTDVEMTLSRDLLGHGNQLILGLAYYRGESGFDSRLELAQLDPVTRSTLGFSTGVFVDSEAVNLETDTETYSIYFTDSLQLGDKLTLTLSGRLNNTLVDLSDLSGERPELNGEHDFVRFNPAVGLTYQYSPRLNIYAGYSESSRAPTPVELACNEAVFDRAAAIALAAGEDAADVDFECRLPNAFLADPPLEQVVAASLELGVRGRFKSLHYHLGLFHTVNRNDIIFQTTGRATGLFANVDETRRMGLEGLLRGSGGGLDWSLSYSYVRATFEDGFQVLSPNHPLADAGGRVRVEPGDRIPGVPEHQFKAGADYYFTEGVSLGLDLAAFSGQFLRGDEANRLPALAGFATLNLRGQYRINDHWRLLGRITNLFDREYESFGLIGESPGAVDVPEFAGFSDARFLGPGAPRAGFIGIIFSR